MSIVEKLKSYIPNGDGYYSEYAEVLTDAVELIERLQAENATFKARIDGGKRMFARIPHGNTQTILAANMDSRANSTLIPDEGVDLL